MPKDLTSAVITQIDAAQKRPVILVELELSSTLRYAACKSNITFPTGGNVYTAKAIKVSGINQSLEGQIQRATIKFDNVSRDMAAYAHNEDFQNKRIVIKRVYLDALGSSDNYNEIFNGYIDKRPQIDRRWLTVSATIGKPLNRKALKICYQRLCPWVFGGTECNTDGNADLDSLKASGTADSGSTTTLVDDALTQADDYWNYGRIEITKGSKTYYRKVKDFVSSTHTVTLDCGANNAWGPSANNQANFAGCLHIAVPTYPQDATTSLDLNPHSSTPSEVDELYAQYRADEAYYEYGEYIGPSKEQIAGFENP